MSLTLTVTQQGRAALVNAKNNGTFPVTVSAVGITGTAFTPGPTNVAQPAIPGEIKRISAISGGAVASDTIHVTVTDNGTDTYSVLGLGVYLADGTLFAVYGQSTAILQKSSQATMLLAADVQFADIAATSLTFGDTNFQLNQATTSIKGIVQLAADSDAIAAADASLVVTPHALGAALDSRFGAGAPTSFVKTLLAAATAVAFRGLLSLKTAALYDTGSGNGLDADTLDGQHGAYYAPLASPAFTGTPTVPTAGAGTNNTQAASTAFVVSALVPYALLASPSLTGTPTVPTAAAGTNSTQAASTAFVIAAVNSVINGAPGALDTLKELADAMNDDPNFAATITNKLALKAPLASPAFTGTATFAARPTFNNATPWDSANFTPGNYQPLLGYTAVQQGTGTGQLSNAVKIGWSGSKVKVTIDSTDMGNLALESWVNSTALLRGATSQTAGTIFASGAPPNMGNISGSGNDRNTSLQISNASNNSASAMMSFIREGVCGVHFGLDTDNVMKIGGWSFGTTTAYRIIHEGIGNWNCPGAITAAGGFQVSDKRFKYGIERRAVDTTLAGKLSHKWSEWFRISDDGFDTGLIAQDLLADAPQFVKVPEDPEEMLAIDKAGVALECALSADIRIERLLSRIEALEARAA